MMTPTQIEALVDVTLRALPNAIEFDSVQTHFDMLEDFHDDDVEDAKVCGDTLPSKPVLSDAIDSFNDDFHGWAHDEQRVLVRELLDFAKGQI